MHLGYIWICGQVIRQVLWLGLQLVKSSHHWCTMNPIRLVKCVGVCLSLTCNFQFFCQSSHKQQQNKHSHLNVIIKQAGSDHKELTHPPMWNQPRTGRVFIRTLSFIQTHSLASCSIANPITNSYWSPFCPTQWACGYLRARRPLIYLFVWPIWLLFTVSNTTVLCVGHLCPSCFDLYLIFLLWNYYVGNFKLLKSALIYAYVNSLV